LVRIRFDNPRTDDEFADYLRTYQQLLDGGHPYGGLIVTAVDLPMTRSKHARMQAEFTPMSASSSPPTCASQPRPLLRTSLKGAVAMAKRALQILQYRCRLRQRARVPIAAGARPRIPVTRCLPGPQ